MENIIILTLSIIISIIFIILYQQAKITRLKYEKECLKIEKEIAEKQFFNQLNIKEYELKHGNKG